MNQNNFIIAGIILVIVAGALGLWIGRAIYLPEPMPEGAIQDSNLLNSLAGGNAIAVNDQPPGVKVIISFVTLAKDGWVAIHEDRDGKPGNILGARRFNAGERQSGAVDLLRATEPEKVYYAMLHSDDGDHQFDRAKDPAVTDPQGNAIMMRFVTAAEPE